MPFHEDEGVPCERRVRAIISKVRDWRLGSRPQSEPDWKATVSEIIDELEQELDSPPTL